MALSIFRRPNPPTSSGRAAGLFLLQQLRARDGQRLRRYQDLLDFYEGKHFARERRGRTSLAVNYARVVADKGVSYLFGRGVHFSVPAEANDAPSPSRRRGEGGRLSERSGDAERILNRVAEENDLDLVLLQAATNASVLGDAALKLFWDAASGRARVVGVDPFRFFPTWAGDDVSTLREVALAGQLSLVEAQERFGITDFGSRAALTLTLSQRERGPGLLPGAGVVDTLELWTATRFRLVVGDQVVRDGPNPYGFIPFVHVPNLQPPNSSWGVSDLTHLIPLNRELDERMSDQADMIRYHADPPVVFRGVEEHSDLPVGPGTVWDLPRDADVALLEWRGNTPAVQDHIERVLRAIYDVSETPRTSFGDSGRLLSGVALETELQPLVHRTLRKRVSWSAALRQCARMLLLLTERFEPGRAPGAFAPYRSQVIWPQMLPRDDDADARRNLGLVQGGLRSHRQAMEALGELDPEMELQRIREERALLQ